EGAGLATSVVVDGRAADSSFDAIGDLIGAMGPDRPETAALLGVLLGSAVPMLGLLADPAFASDLDALAFVHAAPDAPAAIYGIANAGFLVIDGGRRLPLAEDGFVLLTGSRPAQGRIVATADADGRARPGGRFALLQAQARSADFTHLAVIQDGQVRLAAARLSLSEDHAAFVRAHLAARPGMLSLALRRAGGMDAKRLAAEVRRNALPAAAARIDDAAVQVQVAVQAPSGLFVAGWCYGDPRAIDRVEAVDGRLDASRVDAAWRTWPGRAEIDGRLVPTRRFAAHLPGAVGTAGSPQPPIVVTFADGTRRTAVAPPTPGDAGAARRAILDTIDERELTADMFAACYLAPVGSLTAEIAARQAVVGARRYGTAGPGRVSIVIPLYGVTGFIRSQLLAFAADPFLRANAEIVYVLDDPPLQRGLDHFLGGLAGLLRLDVALVVLAENGGYALATNLGVGESRGRDLVLLNSDVVPDAPGWLETLLAARAHRRAGVVGPKLVYPDGALQHAGMYFRPHIGGTWQNMHYAKGFSPAYPPADVERRVPAVTGACMAMTRARFEAVGGFTTDYVIGDYEDSDLCLKLAAAGAGAWYVPSASLLHAERQSVSAHDAHTDDGVSAYNRALHTHRWDDAIRGLMRRHGGHEGVRP
ncbi:MAG TPA: glycosyltransferase, partial [Methylomirabilota bacterium]|nr:glycosyltransferase [Methylomirabilota bacterium]